MTRTAGIVLAAGESRRMGRPKALLPWNGATFLATVVAQLVDAGLDPILVVVGAHAEAIRANGLPAGAGLIDNADWPSGQFSSLRAAISQLPGDVMAAVVALVDQPQIDANLVRRLVETHAAKGAPVVRPTWNGRGGHPLLLGSRLFPAILAAPTTATTHEVLSSFRAEFVDMTVEDDSILVDFDTPEDLARESSRLGKQF